MGLVEPHLVAGDRMCTHRLANLPGGQALTIIPGKRDVVLLAKMLDRRFFVSLKYVLPREVQPFAVVPYVHHSLVRKFLANSSRDPLVHTSTIGDRCLTILRSPLHAKESELHRPRARVSEFVVQRYRLMGRIFRG